MASAWHTDEASIGWSAIFALGDFTGGQFETKVSADASPVSFVIRDHILRFDGALLHRAAPHRGSRISVVAYQQPLRSALSSGLVGSLKQLGFIVNDPHAWRSPVRVALEIGAVKAGSQVMLARPFGVTVSGLLTYTQCGKRGRASIGSRRKRFDSSPLKMMLRCVLTSWIRRGSEYLVLALFILVVMWMP